MNEAPTLSNIRKILSDISRQAKAFELPVKFDSNLAVKFRMPVTYKGIIMLVFDSH